MLRAMGKRDVGCDAPTESSAFLVFVYGGTLQITQSAFLMYMQEVVASRRITMVSTRGVTMMGKFCSNCGAEVSGNFCSECGQPTDGAAPIAESIVRQETLNGVSFDPVPIFAAHKGRGGQIDLIKDLAHATGASISAAKAFADAHYADSAFMQEVEAYVPPPMKCPFCNSTNIQVQQSGYKFGRGLVGTVLFGVLGAFAGGIGAKSVTCLCANCGKSFSPPKR